MGSFFLSSSGENNRKCAGAMSLLAVAAGSVSTLAWFKTSGASTISAYTPDTKDVVTVGGSLQMGSFTVTAVPANPDHSVQLTTTGGKSYVFTGGGSVGQAGSGKVEVAVTAGVATIDCKLKVTYNSADDEPAKTGAEIKTIWLATIGNKAIGIKATSANSKVRFLASASPANAAAWEGTAYNTGVTYSVSNSNLINLSFNDCAGDEATADSTTTADAASDFFVAITGDDTNVEETANFTITFTPQTAA